MACADTFTRTLTMGSVLFQCGTSADFAVIVRKGSVKLFLDGQIDVGNFGCGSVLGLPEVLACRTYQTDAIAVEDTVAEYIGQRALFTRLLHNSYFSMEVLEGVSNDVGALIAKIQSFPRSRKHSGNVHSTHEIRQSTLDLHKVA